MDREAIELMAAFADSRKINRLDRQLRARFGPEVYNGYEDEMYGEYRNYNVIATAFDYYLSCDEIKEMIN